MFEFARAATTDLPPQRDGTIDVALLDMHHGWPNVGHDAIVSALSEITDELSRETENVSVRVLSFDVRDRMVIPRHDGRFRLYVGSGGPGHLDPRENRGRSDAEIEEDPAWEAPLFDLFDAIAADPQTAFVGVCHTFGLLCRWRGIARPVLRGPKEHGKSTGVQQSTLSGIAAVHPWFSQLVDAVGTTVPVVDSRYYDLVALGQPPPGVSVIACEPGQRDDLVYTMVEFARNEGETIPRIFASNHHPEVPGPEALQRILAQKVRNEEVTQEWYDERTELIEILKSGAHDERARLLTSDYTFRLILKTHLERMLVRKAETHGSPIPSAL